MKITFMGAGSTVFVRKVIGDCMLSSVLAESTFALYDIDPVRLQESKEILSVTKQTTSELDVMIRTANRTAFAVQINGNDVRVFTNKRQTIPAVFPAQILSPSL